MLIKLIATYHEKVDAIVFLTGKNKLLESFSNRRVVNVQKVFLKSMCLMDNLLKRNLVSYYNEQVHIAHGEIMLALERSELHDMCYMVFYLLDECLQKMLEFSIHDTT